MAMMNRLESGDPVWGRCSWCCVTTMTSAVCLLDSVLCSICHWWLVARCGFGINPWQVQWRSISENMLWLSISLSRCAMSQDWGSWRLAIVWFWCVFMYVCMCDGCSRVFSSKRNLHLIFKIILIYCNLYEVLNICKFSMPTVIHCNSVLELGWRYTLCRRWHVHLFLIPCCCHCDDEQTRVGWPCMRTMLLMLCDHDDLCSLSAGQCPV